MWVSLLFICELIIFFKPTRGQQGVWVRAIPEDAHWEEWGNWSGCSALCGGGVSRRTRKCPNSRFGGTRVCAAEGSGSEELGCNNQPCGEWSLWSNSSCSVTCGVGEMVESRQCVSTISNEVVEPTVCGEDTYSFTHECLIDLCWDVVIQRRGQFGNPIEYFYRNWDEYVSGFGEQDGEFWLGLEQIYQKTNEKRHALKIYMESPDGRNAEVRYSTFKLTENVNYTLFLDGFQGNDSVGDALEVHNGMSFTTKDRDQDNHPGNCAVVGKGAWWYNACMRSNLNGRNYNSVSAPSYGIDWRTWTGTWHSLSFVEMSIAENPT